MLKQHILYYYFTTQKDYQLLNEVQNTPTSLADTLREISKKYGTKVRKNIVNNSFLHARRGSVSFVKAMFWNIHQHLILDSISDDEGGFLFHWLSIRSKVELKNPTSNKVIDDVKSRHEATSKVIDHMIHRVKNINQEFNLKLDMDDLMNISYSLRNVNVIPHVKIGNSKIPDDNNQNTKANIAQKKDMYVLKLHMIFFQIKLNMWKL